MYQTKQKKQFCRFNWCCGIRNDEQFDFFPIAFLLYMIFMFIICAIITFKYIYDEEITIYEYNHHDETYMSSLPLISPDITHRSRYQLSSYLDWIIYCFILISILWEALFSFYRYHTTIISARYFYAAGWFDVMKHFFAYSCILLILFICQTQFYYWSFPLVFLFYFILRIYWIHRVAFVLILSYEQLAGTFLF